MMKFPLLYCTLFVSGLLYSNNSEAQIFKKINEALNKASQGQTDSTKTTNTSTTGSSTSSSNKSNPLASLSNKDASLGIKQALSNGLNLSIESLAKKDGFLGDAAVKILMPAEAQKVEKTLRAVGMGKLCDQFIQSMNRAAEGAVKEAAPVFVNALSKMTITDATNILLGSKQDAATTFFKTNTSTELTNKFSPVIQSAMGVNNVDQYWTQLTSAYNNLPLGNKVETNLTAYVTQKAIDGLFIKVADQESKIRNNIGGSRNTNILQKVFGYADDKK
ncbi:DUF4197 domain-containing protein [Sphingobacterium puteale]|uniref:DUF4197 domain-containing protein n=1 Tax=Sphingobacterium puteale TaxID=2420510 RepID=A0A420W496_9SPHI|nr:DUF4197 domain-containing protein [Sphingobacterium puteale]RKO73393.1 DUF4197 domain-containing protein [Sphingobacterium puteale]